MSVLPGVWMHNMPVQSIPTSSPPGLSLSSPTAALLIILQYPPTQCHLDQHSPSPSGLWCRWEYLCSSGPSGITGIRFTCLEGFLVVGNALFSCGQVIHCLCLSFACRRSAFPFLHDHLSLSRRRSSLRSAACTLTSVLVSLTQRMMPANQPSCSVIMSLIFPMVDRLAKVMFAGQPMILTLRPWTILSS